jgi:hypothetical protein
MFRPSDHKSKELGKATASPRNQARIIFSPKSCREPKRPTSETRDPITVVPDPWHAKPRKRKRPDPSNTSRTSTKNQIFPQITSPHNMAPSRTFRETRERNRTAAGSPWGSGSPRRRRRPWRTGGCFSHATVSWRIDGSRQEWLAFIKREGGGGRQRGTTGASRPQERDWKGRALRFLLRL